MFQFWYDYIKPKYQDNAKLCYMDTDSFTFLILKLKIFMKTLQMMLKKDVKHEIGMKSPDHCLQERVKRL